MRLQRWLKTVVFQVATVAIEALEADFIKQAYAMLVAVMIV